MNTKTTIFSILAILFLIAFGFWFNDNYEFKEIETDSGFQGEAKTNDLYAARLFLKRMGVPTQKVTYTKAPDNTDTVIFLNTNRYNISKEKTQLLLNWVEQGGHLIARIRNNLSLMGLNDSSDNKADKGDLLQNTLKVDIGEYIYIDDEKLPLKLKLPNSDETLKVDLDFFYEIIARDDIAFKASHDSKNWLVQKKYGKGLVTFLSESSIFENTFLEDEDHAKLLWYLIHSHSDAPQEVWLVDSDEYPPLITLLYKYAWTVLLACTLLLMLAFWSWLPRFGPQINMALPYRRQLLEHIRASGIWLWKTPDQRQERLIKTTRQTIQQLAQKRLSGGQLLEDRNITQSLAAYLKWPDNQYQALEHLLKAPELTDVEFLRLVQIAHNLRNPT